MREGLVHGSFRDPSGFLFVKDGVLYRQVNTGFRDEFEMLVGSGLYAELVGARLITSHEEAPKGLAVTGDSYKVIRPEPVPFISYPYEWSFSQLKDAALLTLDIQKRALVHGMSLKDASAFNVQFLGGRPILIDTLSFERYHEGEPWVAYKQFCTHFLAPLSLMSLRDVRLGEWFRISIDGTPLDLAAKLLSKRTMLKFPLLLHIHMHAKSQLKYSSETNVKRGRKFSRLAMEGLIDSLEGAVRKLTWIPRGTEWADYYKDTNYLPESLNHKKQLVAELLEAANPKIVWDLGANDGTFSRIACNKGCLTVSFDIDPACVEMNYRMLKERGEANILPLVMDLTNPSPDLGWDNAERLSLTSRGPCDTAMALALIHHIAISNNVPLLKIAGYLRRLCRSLIIEFVPKDDSQVKRLLLTREDVFPDYTKESFENSFSNYFEILKSVQIKGSDRVLYLMKGV